MRYIGITELLVMFVMAIVLFNGKEKFARILEALSNFRGGGPGSPSHPIPADDSKILNRPREPDHPEKQLDRSALRPPMDGPMSNPLVNVY